MKLAAALLILGLALIWYASSMPAYTDEELFMERYMNMSAGQSEEYWKLRDEMLSPKYELQDYGGTLLMAAVVVFLVTRKGWASIKSPASQKTVVALAIGLPFLTVGGVVFDLILAYTRGEFPHWADSMSIPLLGVPVLFILLFVWSSAHLGFLRGGYRPTTPLAVAVSPKANWWLMLISALTVLLALECAVFGDYFYMVPGVVWLYFYLSLGASRRAAKNGELGRRQ